MLSKSAAVLVLSLIVFSLPAWGLEFKPGMYEITSTVEMPGMPAGSVPPQTITQCLTEQDPAPNKGTGDQECKMIKMDKDGNTVTWKMECDQQGQKLTSDGEIIYKGDNFKGTITTLLGPEAGNMTIKTVIAGNRIGNCQ